MTKRFPTEKLAVFKTTVVNSNKLKQYAQDNELYIETHVTMGGIAVYTEIDSNKIVELLGGVSE
ncbi:hypothetical protein [Sporosarcina sp. SAFN-015]|uniref:hypothetical protein n=1 Tax=Sporosarcina sp. SAFN-015 TaxID=3387274 RepID=UPI003F8163A6